SSWSPEMSPLSLVLLSLAAPVYPDRTKLLVWRDDHGREHAITKSADWPRRRAHILAAMQEVMGALPAAERKVPLDVQVNEETRTDKVIRRKITFAVEKGDRVPAYLFLPRGVKGKVPAVLCLHPTSRE